MKKVFVSQPMDGLSDEEILQVSSDALVYAANYLGEDVREIPSFFNDSKDLRHVEALGLSIKLMADADLIVFCPGWEEERSCRIEHKVAEEYDFHFKQID